MNLEALISTAEAFPLHAIRGPLECQGASGICRQKWGWQAELGWKKYSACKLFLDLFPHACLLCPLPLERGTWLCMKNSVAYIVQWKKIPDMGISCSGFQGWLFNFGHFKDGPQFSHVQWE